MFIVYKYTSPSGKSYVGKTSSTRERKRMMEHKNDSINGSEFYFHRAIRKYGYDNFSYEIIGTFKTEYEALEFEKKQIKELNLTNRNLGYNQVDGGSGVTMTVEIREKIRNKAIGRKHSNPEQAAKRLRTLKENGYVISEDGRKKISKSLSGRKKSAEHIEKLKKSASNRSDDHYKKMVETRKKNGTFNTPKEQLERMTAIRQANAIKIDQFTKSGEFVKTWNSRKEICESLRVSGGNITSCCKEKLKSAYGYVWKYSK